MVIHLGSGRKRKVQKGRNFVWNRMEQTAFDTRLSERQAQMMKPLVKRISTKASRKVDELARQVKQDLASKRLTFEQVTDKMLVSIDQYIIEQLPLQKSVKQDALNAQGYEAHLSTHFAHSIQRTPIPLHNAISLIEEGLFSFKQLQKPYSMIPKRTEVATLERKLSQLRESRQKQVLMTFPEMLTLKTINAGRVRQILGEEMASVYQMTYTMIKQKLATSLF
jgi:hypothetical protein